MAKGKPWRWWAQYQTGSNEKRKFYQIDGAETSECPTSLISPRSSALVQLIATAKRAKEFSGAAFGVDSAEWDPRFYDAVQVIAIEEIKEHNARFEAERSS